MKKTVLFATLALLGAIVFAQERTAIAVFPFEDMDNLLTQNESVLFYRRFSNEFVNRNNGRFRVVPRQDVEKLINTEAKFQLSDFSARAKTAEMQRVLNGSQILSGNIGKMGTKLAISISLFSYPDLEQLPGGVDIDVANKDELFAKIPDLVQSMTAAIAENEAVYSGYYNGSGTNSNAGISGGTGVAFAGDRLATRSQQTIISGIREAVQARKLNLVIDEKTKASSGYGFTVTVYCEQVTTNGARMIKAEATAAFSRGGQILFQSAPYYITETDETLIARRIAERLKGDKAFFDKVNELVQ